MIIEDPIYGRFDIQEDVIIELLQDPTVLRLKTISQGGTTAYINNYQEFSRFDHSVGVMLLVRHLGASLDEQIAALLHDISHTAFSHIIDYVYKSGGEESYHESIKEKIILNSNIPPILKRNRINVDYISDEHNFLLLERPKPQLCADRVDYALRCLYFYLKKTDTVKTYYTSLINHNNEIVFNSEEVAHAFAKDFLDLDKNIFTNIRNLAAYFIMADGIKKALNENYITEEDFFDSDDELLVKLKSIDNDEIKRLLDLVNTNLQVEINSTDYDYVLKTKERFVDPKFFKNGKTYSVLEVDKELAKDIEEYSRHVSRPQYVKVIK